MQSDHSGLSGGLPLDTASGAVATLGFRSSGRAPRADLLLLPRLCTRIQK